MCAESKKHRARRAGAIVCNDQRAVQEKADNREDIGSQRAVVRKSKIAIIRRTRCRCKACPSGRSVFVVERVESRLYQSCGLVARGSVAERKATRL